jgi:hypothetical protein
MLSSPSLQDGQLLSGAFFVSCLLQLSVAPGIQGFCSNTDASMLDLFLAKPVGFLFCLSAVFPAAIYSFSLVDRLWRHSTATFLPLSFSEESVYNRRTEK